MKHPSRPKAMERDHRRIDLGEVVDFVLSVMGGTPTLRRWAVGELRDLAPDGNPGRDLVQTESSIETGRVAVREIKSLRSYRAPGGSSSLFLPNKLAVLRRQS